MLTPGKVAVVFACIFVALNVLLVESLRSKNIAKVEPPLSLSSREPMNWSKVPKELRALIPLAQRWGAVSSDSERYAVADYAKVDRARMAELYLFACLWDEEANKAYEEWSKRVKLTESMEMCKFYFLHLLLDELQIEIP